MRRTSHGFRAAWLVPVCALALLVTPQAFAAGSTGAGSTAASFVSFATFRSQLNHGATASSAAVSEMQTYLRKLYARVDARTSFITDGAYFDCVTLASQPAVTALGIKHIATPPTLAAPTTHDSRSAWTTTGTDAHGAVVSCPAGTVPMRRTTLSEVSRYRTLHAFLSRGKVNPAVVTSDYRYAHAFQLVNNHGAVSTINTWNPKVPTGPVGDDHSLSQQWMSGGSGTNLQTAEAGWTKDPGMSTAKPIYFTYFTADGYNTTGCYSLECPAFVQMNNSVALGAPVKPCCSKPNKADDKFIQQWFLTGGNWWLNINGTYIGYYPTTLYSGGQMSQNATEVDFGGEVNASVHTANWPPMGSGKPASAGFKQAAYQSAIEYIGLNDQFALASLTPNATSKCYTIAYSPASGGNGPFFYFGGKGGKRKAC